MMLGILGRRKKKKKKAKVGTVRQMSYFGV